MVVIYFEQEWVQIKIVVVVRLIPWPEQSFLGTVLSSLILRRPRSFAVPFAEREGSERDRERPRTSENQARYWVVVLSIVLLSSWGLNNRNLILNTWVFLSILRLIFFIVQFRAKGGGISRDAFGDLTEKDYLKGLNLARISQMQNTTSSDRRYSF